jgi:cellulose synthase operon protein C
MRSVKLQLIAAAVVACFGASVALACGVHFPWQLLDNRAATLDTMPIDTNSFAYAEAHLFPSPNDKLTVEETEYGGEDRSAETVNADVAGLASDQADVVRQMRAEASGDGAFNRGAMLPAAVRLYTAGAVDFHKGDSAKAIRRFQSILDLPATERRDREVWAAFMLGRLYSSKNNIAEASKSFALTRELANNGAPDPLGLGVASFGEEARLHLKRAEALQKAKKMSSKQRRVYGRDVVAAIRLYAEQAAHGSNIGIDSLRRVVDEVIGDDAAVAASICDPMVQQLLVTRTLDAESDAVAPNTPATSQISTLVTSVQKCGAGNLIAADRLAAIAYRDGDYQLAHGLAIQMTTPLAMWVQARLALQKGDVGEAAKYYAAASKAFPSSGDTSAADQRAKALLVGENGVLTLARGEYVDALEQLYPYATTFWGDVAYIAERVLTVDELKTFVDTHKDTQFNPSVSLDSPTNPDDPTASEPGDSENVPGPADQLRDLLARRLVRAGRYHEALKYFPPPAAETPTAVVPPTMVPGRGAPIIIRVGPSVFRRIMIGGQGAVAVGLFPLGFGIAPNTSAPQKAPESFFADYAQALADANTDKSNIDRARGWYRAATLAGDFKSGSQIMATEGPLDNYKEPEFSFGGVGRFKLRADDQFVTDGERQRFKASAPKPNFRYHYLFVAVDEALHAADLLPPRSQAFAAVLCHATSWMTDGESCLASAGDLRASSAAYRSTAPSVADPLSADVRWPNGDTARINFTCQLYQRYLKEGAVVPWATHFGRHCPEPDFDSAIHFVEVQTIHEARRHSQIVHHRWIALAKLALIALCLGASTWWFLRHRYV